MPTAGTQWYICGIFTHVNGTFIFTLWYIHVNTCVYILTCASDLLEVISATVSKSARTQTYHCHHVGQPNIFVRRQTHQELRRPNIRTHQTLFPEIGWVPLHLESLHLEWFLAGTKQPIVSWCYFAVFPLAWRETDKVKSVRIMPPNGPISKVPWSWTSWTVP